MSRKNNQAKRKFAVRGDDEELVALGQFLREVFPISVKREWYILFDRFTGEFVRAQQNQPHERKYKYRHPDLMIFDTKYRKTETVIHDKPYLCYELDGMIHDLKIWKTNKRNDDYKRSGIELVVTTKSIMFTNIFDSAYSMIEKILKDKFKLLQNQQ